jgi:predicted NAD-dependent protein-ADP-ribosyltransferase YbiA (DUF1768 family)
MVRSLINSTIDYPVKKTLYDEDKEFEASMYRVTILDDEVIVALGQAKYTFIENNIIFFPIYLVKHNKVDVQIGIYEIAVEDLASIMDDEGDVDISLLGEPLLYPFVSKVILTGKPIRAEVDAEVDAEVKGIIISAQTVEEAIKERDSFKFNKTLPWIQRFMKNNNYKIVDNEGKGDCLFAAIRDGLKMAGVNTSVDDMRKVLAENATDDIFQNYKKLYDASVEEEKKLAKEIKVLSDRHAELKKQITLEKDRSTQQAIVAQAEEIGKRYKDIKQDRAATKTMMEEFKFIKGIKDLEMFKLKIQTCGFWGDTWAISTLERVLKIKMVLMSRANFRADDEDNVLTCGQLNDEILEAAGKFEPDHYIILDYSGSHYQLITYKDHGAFTFNELPYDIKTLVVNKCLERQAGPYYIIPDFKEFMKNEVATANAANAANTVELQSDLYDKATVFQFYSKSLDSAAPGKGAGETIGPEGVSFYSDLTKIPSWRKKLSNFWESEFTLDGKKWLSVEHYYQGSKYKRGNPRFYAQFSLDSGSAISKDPLLAKIAGGKSGKIKGDLIRPKDVAMDKDFFEVRKDGFTRANLEMQASMMAKFSQNEELKRLLKATKKAKLNHFSRGSPPVVFTDLMIVRQQI